MRTGPDGRAMKEGENVPASNFDISQTLKIFISPSPYIISQISSQIKFSVQSAPYASAEYKKNPTPEGVGLGHLGAGISGLA